MGTCVVCDREYLKYRNNQKYCSNECKRKTEKKYSNSTLNHLTSSKIGAISEIEMCAYYIRQGYEVFRNMSPDGAADIIIWNPKNGELHILDIKSYIGTTNPDNYILREEEKRNFIVKVVPYDYNSKMPLRPLENDL